MNISLNLDSCEKQIQNGKLKGTIGALQIGKALLAINEGNLWAGSGAKNFESYVSQAHGFSRSTAYNLMSIYFEFGQQLLADPSLQTIDTTRLIRLLPFTENHDKETLLHSAAQIPDTAGWENNLRNMRGKVGTDECCHPEGFKPVGYEVCPICNQRRKVGSHAA